MNSLNWTKKKYNFSNVLLILYVKYFYNRIRFKVVVVTCRRGALFFRTQSCEQCRSIDRLVTLFSLRWQSELHIVTFSNCKYVLWINHTVILEQLSTNWKLCKAQWQQPQREMFTGRAVSCIVQQLNTAVVPKVSKRITDCGGRR